MAPQANTQRKKKRRDVTHGVAHIGTSFNNTWVVVTDKAGNKLDQSSAGACGFRGARKSTPFAAQTAAETIAKKMYETYGMKRIEVNVSGPGAGREPAIRGLRSVLTVVKVTDVTRLPHNGCRPKKKRRV